MSTIASKKIKTAKDVKTADPVKKLILQRIRELETAITQRAQTIDREMTDLQALTSQQTKQKLELKRLLSEIDGLETKIDLTEVEK